MLSNPEPPRDPALDLPLIEARIRESRGFRILRMQRALQYSRYLHFKNYGDIAPLATPISKPEVLKQLFPIGSTNMNQFLLEIIRRLVNYVNSSCYLVDHTGFLLGKIYGRRDPLRIEIEGKLDSTYFGSAIPEFVRGLRHTGAHVTLPMVMLAFSTEHGHLEAKLNLESWREAATDWKKLPAARAYIAGLKENPALLPILHDYHQLDSQFFHWLDARQREAHKEEFQEFEALQQELRDKYREAGINPVEFSNG